MRLIIKELREENRWTQKELADKIGSSQRNVSNWENGTSEPDCETIVKLADIFDVTLDELFGRSQQILFSSESAAFGQWAMLGKLTDEQKIALKELINAFLR